MTICRQPILTIFRNLPTSTPKLRFLSTLPRTRSLQLSTFVVRRPAFTIDRMKFSTSAPTMTEMSKDEQNALPENEQWKLRSPYKVHNPDDGFKALYEGACHCGKVTFQLSREKPLASKYCHCADCQIMHGLLPLKSKYHFGLLWPFESTCPSIPRQESSTQLTQRI